MGRPQAPDTVPYYSHVTVHTTTTRSLCRKWKAQGYSFWWHLLECLGSTNGHAIFYCNSIVKEDFEDRCESRLGISPQLTKEILNFLAEVEAIDTTLWEHGVIWSQNFVDGLGEVYKNRKRGKPIKPDTTQLNAVKPLVEKSREEKRRVEHPAGKTKKQVYPLESPYYKLSKLIIEHAASLDAEDVGLNKDEPEEREERVQKSAKDIQALIETSWGRWDRTKAIRMAVDVWRWLLREPNRPGFMWKKNIQCGNTFRFHCDSTLTRKKKPGGKLLQQYTASPEFTQKQEAEVRKLQAKAQKYEFDDDKKQAEESRRVEDELSALKKKDKEAWAQKIFEMFGLNLDSARADPIMSKMPRVAEAITILTKELR